MKCELFRLKLYILIDKYCNTMSMRIYFWQSRWNSNREITNRYQEYWKTHRLFDKLFIALFAPNHFWIYSIEYFRYTEEVILTTMHILRTNWNRNSDLSNFILIFPNRVYNNQRSFSKKKWCFAELLSSFQRFWDLFALNLPFSVIIFYTPKVRTPCKLQNQRRVCTCLTQCFRRTIEDKHVMISWPSPDANFLPHCPK